MFEKMETTPGGVFHSPRPDRKHRRTGEAFVDDTTLWLLKLGLFLSAAITLMQQTDTYTFYIEPGYSDIYVQTVKTELQAKTGKTIQILELYHMNGSQDSLDYIGQMEKNLQSLHEGLGS